MVFLSIKLLLFYGDRSICMVVLFSCAQPAREPWWPSTHMVISELLATMMWVGFVSRGNRRLDMVNNEWFNKRIGKQKLEDKLPKLNSINASYWSVIPRHGSGGSPYRILRPNCIPVAIPSTWSWPVNLAWILRCGYLLIVYERCPMRGRSGS